MIFAIVFFFHTVISSDYLLSPPTLCYPLRWSVIYSDYHIAFKLVSTQLTNTQFNIAFTILECWHPSHKNPSSSLLVIFVFVLSLKMRRRTRLKRHFFQQHMARAEPQHDVRISNKTNSPAPRNTYGSNCLEMLSTISFISVTISSSSMLMLTFILKSVYLSSIYWFAVSSPHHPYPRGIKLLVGLARIANWCH